MICFLHQSTAASTWWCGPRPRLGWVEMAVGLPEGPSYPGHSPFVFLLCCPMNDRKRAAHSFFKIGRLFSLFPFSCLSLALLRLLLLLMSGNVHPNPGPIFPCSVCAGNVTWRGKSVQCCACSKWVHLRCSQLSLFRLRALGSSHSWSCPPCRITVTLSSDSFDMYTSTVQSSPASANAALSPHPRLQTSHPPSAHSINYVGIIISLNNSFSVSFLNGYAPPYSLLPNGWQNRFLFSLYPSLLQKSRHSWGLQLPSPPLRLKRYLRPPRGGSIRLGHFF